jgi:hypothetical protein
MFGKIVRIGLILLLSVNVFGGKIDKAYEALKIYDYFKAKSIFQETLEDEPVAARYGLTIIYYRNDNPFHNLDTAYAYIQKVEVDYENLRKKDQEQLLEYSIDSEHILKMKNDIILAFWNDVKDTKSVKSLNAFIKKFPNFYDIENVKKIRTDLAYEQTVERNTFKSYSEFVTTYPDDPRSEEAKVIYEKKLYEEKTKDGKLQSYIDFIYIYPESPYVNDASDKIFLMSTETGTVKSYKWFVDRFPDSPHANEAWRKLYVLSFTDFNDNEIRDFIKNNHNFPFPKIFSESRVLRDLELYQIKKDDKWGYIDKNGNVKIEPQYEFENDFSNEYALVANEEYVGYINKKGKQVIDFIYDDGGDFIEGVAYVIKGDSVALINKLGYKVLDFEFSEISDAKDGVVLTKRIEDEKYAYYNIFGKNLFGDRTFDFAEVFEDSLAIVGDSGKFGVINIKGNLVVDINKPKIIRDVKGRFIIQNEDSKYGLVALPSNDTIIPFEYVNIGAYSDGKYAVFSEESYTYVKEDGSKLTDNTFLRYEGDVKESEFRKGFAITQIRHKKGIIDSLGMKMFPNIFEEIGDIVDYPIPCKKRGKWGYVTKKITMWLPYKYDYAGAFYDGQAIVARNGRYAVINKHKKVVIPYKYTMLSEFKNDYYLAVKQGKFGVIDKKGIVILPFYYANITEFKGDLLTLYYKGEIYYYNLKKKIFIYGSFPK